LYYEVYAHRRWGTSRLYCPLVRVGVLWAGLGSPGWRRSGVKALRGMSDVWGRPHTACCGSFLGWGQELQRWVLVIGASTRGAAASVRRAGLVPVCLDLFGDADLQLLAERVGLIGDYPQSIPADLARLVDSGLPGELAGWMYTGGLENYPEIVAEIAGLVGEDVPCWSAMPDVLVKVRDPFWLQATIRATAGFGELACLRRPTESMGDGRWLVKSRKSAGGLTTRYWQPDATMGEDDYLQRYCEGKPFSVVAYRDGERMVSLGAAVPIAVPTATISGERPFLYLGSVAPIGLPQMVQATVDAILGGIARESGLHGVIGADFVWNNEGVWLLEINPRYTASMELYELATGCRVLDYFDGWKDCPVFEASERERPQVVAKRIVYAERDIELMRPLGGELSSPMESLWDVPLLADVPQVPCVLPAGSPVCTVYGTGECVEIATAMANERGSRLMAELFG
jgi:uncharacterized protein